MSEMPRFLVRPLYLQVRDELASRVAARTWTAGACLPNEVVLATELGVSQGTIRKALDVMESEKLVVRRQGRGTFVVDASSAAMQSRFNSFFLDSGSKPSGTVCEIASQFVRADHAAQESLGVEPAERLCRLERIHSYDSAPYLFEASTIVCRHWPNAKDVDLTRSSITELAQKFGVVLSHAVERVAAELSPPDVADMLGVNEGDAVLRVNRVIYSDRGERVEWRRGWCSMNGISFVAVTN